MFTSGLTRSEVPLVSETAKPGRPQVKLDWRPTSAFHFKYAFVFSALINKHAFRHLAAAAAMAPRAAAAIGRPKATRTAAAR